MYSVVVDGSIVSTVAFVVLVASVVSGIFVVIGNSVVSGTSVVTGKSVVSGASVVSGITTTGVVIIGACVAFGVTEGTVLTDGVTVGADTLVAPVSREASYPSAGAELSAVVSAGIVVIGVFCIFFWQAVYALINRLYDPIHRISVLSAFCCCCISVVLPASRNVMIVASSVSR